MIATLTLLLYFMSAYRVSTLKHVQLKITTTMIKLARRDGSMGKVLSLGPQRIVPVNASTGSQRQEGP